MPTSLSVRSSRANTTPLLFLATTAVAVSILHFAARRRRRRVFGTPVEGTDAATVTAVARRLGWLERWYVAHSRAGYHTGFSLCVTLQAKPPHDDDAVVSPSPWTMAKLRRQLPLVGKQFPWLRGKIRRDGVAGVDRRDGLDPVASSHKTTTTNTSSWGDDLYVELADELCHPTTKHVVLDGSYVSPASSESFRSILRDESVTPWHDENPVRPLWRVTLVTWKDTPEMMSLICSFHHAIADAMSALEVVQAIVDVVGCGGNVQVTRETAACSPEFPPPMEDLVDTVPTIGHMIRPILFDCFPRLEAWWETPHWRGNVEEHCTSTTTCRATDLVCVTLVVVHDASVLVAALARAVRIVVAKESLSSSVCLTIQMAADERRRRACSVPYSALGTYVTAPRVRWTAHDDNTSSSSSSSSLMDSGQRWKERFRASLRSSPWDVGLLAWIGQDWIAWSHGRAGQAPNGVYDSLEVSVLNGHGGVRDGPDWKVRDLWFTQGRRGWGPAILVTCVEGSEGWNACLSAFPGAVPKAQLNDIANTWKQLLQDL